MKILSGSYVDDKEEEIFSSQEIVTPRRNRETLMEKVEKSVEQTKAVREM